MSGKNMYKGLFGLQSEFSHKYSCWANNHNGWGKFKKSNKRLAKRHLSRESERIMTEGRNEY